jgi:hypothetical protein
LCALFVARGSQRENPSVYCKAARRCKSRAVLKREKSQQMAPLTQTRESENDSK